MKEQFYFIDARCGRHIPQDGALAQINAKMQAYDRCIVSRTTLEDICLSLNEIAEGFDRKHTRGRHIRVDISFGADAYIHAGRATYTCLSVNEYLG